MSWAAPQQRRWFNFPLPLCPALPAHLQHDLLIYLSGICFAAAWWVFVDVLVRAAQLSLPIRVEWAPGIALTLGMLIVNSLDQSRLVPDSYGSVDEDAWKVRLAFFIGVAVMVTACAGSLLILVSKYQGEDMYAHQEFGFAIIGQCALLVLSSVFMWTAQNTEGEYQIALNSI